MDVYRALNNQKYIAAPFSFYLLGAFHKFSEDWKHQPVGKKQGLDDLNWFAIVPKNWKHVKSISWDAHNDQMTNI